LLGYEWLHAGWEKLQSPAWMAGGKALQGFVKGAIAASNEPEHPQVAYGWWVNFLGWVSDNASWMAKLVAVGETAIGICLIWACSPASWRSSASSSTSASCSPARPASTRRSPSSVCCSCWPGATPAGTAWTGGCSPASAPWYRGELFDRQAADGGEVRTT
jgi:hypothetical protein